MASMLTVTSMASGRKIDIPRSCVVSWIPFTLNGEEHCFINLEGGFQIKARESVRELGIC